MDVWCDAGDMVTLNGGNAASLFNVTGGRLSVQNIALVNGKDTVGNPGAAAILVSGGHEHYRHDLISGHHSNFGGCPAYPAARGCWPDSAWLK